MQKIYKNEIPEPDTDITHDAIKQACAHAPTTGRTAPNLLGVWVTGTVGDWYVCAPCVGRIAARGASQVLRGASQVWRDGASLVVGVCMCCGK